MPEAPPGGGGQPSAHRPGGQAGTLTGPSPRPSPSLLTWFSQPTGQGVPRPGRRTTLTHRQQAGARGVSPESRQPGGLEAAPEWGGSANPRPGAGAEPGGRAGLRRLKAAGQAHWEPHSRREEGRRRPRRAEAQPWARGVLPCPQFPHLHEGVSRSGQASRSRQVLERQQAWRGRWEAGRGGGLRDTACGL